MTACYPGSFDPVTLGHMDVIKRVAKVVEKLFIAVMDNPDKKPLFTAAERVGFIRDEVKGFLNIEVEPFSGMAAAFVAEKKADIIIRGVRDFNDYQYELTMAEYNKELTGGTDTWFISPSPGLAHISSGAVKEVAKLIIKNGADNGILSSLVPERIIGELKIHLTTGLLAR